MKSEEEIRPLLMPFSGYLDLGMLQDAVESLESLPTELKHHPLVLSARLELLMHTKRWEEGVILAQSLTGLWPKYHEFHFRAAFCLHELRRTKEAKQTLLNAPMSIRDEPLFFYNMACYEAQLGDLQRAKELLAACLKKAPQMKAGAIDDRDLAPVWDSFDTPYPVGPA